LRSIKSVDVVVYSDSVKIFKLAVGLTVIVITVVVFFSQGTPKARAVKAKITEFSGKVVKVADGDTITVLARNVQIRVRLQGIDAPEAKQAFGNRSKQFVSSLCMGAVVRVSPRSTGIDRYGRVLGEVTLQNGKSLNVESVSSGMSWWYQKYAPKDKVLRDAELSARKAKRGLWSDPNPLAPWEFRKVKREASTQGQVSTFGFQSIWSCRSMMSVRGCNDLLRGKFASAALWTASVGESYGVQMQ
jgi:endonuclease YncB( thermonuclease family)